MIQYECFCGYTREVPDDWIDRTVKCPKCGNTGTVFKIAEPPSIDEQWNLSDGYVPRKMRGHYRSPVGPGYQEGPTSITWNQGACIITLLAIPFVLAALWLVLVIIGAMLR